MGLEIRVDEDVRVRWLPVCCDPLRHGATRYGKGTVFAWEERPARTPRGLLLVPLAESGAGHLLRVIWALEGAARASASVSSRAMVFFAILGVLALVCGLAFGVAAAVRGLTARHAGVAGVILLAA